MESWGTTDILHAVEVHRTHMPRLGEGRSGPGASGIRCLPLLVLELVGALATHAVPVVSVSDVL